MAKYSVNNYSVDTLLSWIDSGEIAIPEIQRPFVWDASKVRDLIDSLYKGYPVGYIITWKNPDVKLKDGTLSSGKKVLIDGQQRITALTAAVNGLPVIDNTYKKIRIKIGFNPLKEAFEVCNPAIEKDIQWIPDISVVFKSDFNMFSFITDYANANDINPAEISNVISTLNSIRSNNIGVIDLSSTLDIETVTDIFIRINSKGVVLSQADFAMSKISANSVFGGDIIRKTVDYFCHLKQRPMDIEMIERNDVEFSKTEQFSKIKWICTETDDIYVPTYNDVLRVAFTSQFLRGRLSDLVSLLSGRNFETREYLEEIAKDSFDKLQQGVMKFINQTNFKRYLMIVKSTGIIDQKLIRSQNVLNFGYILYILLKDKDIDSNIIEKVVRKWIVLSILTGRYSGSPESIFDYDIKRFNQAEDPRDYLNNVEAGELSDAYWNNILVTKLDTSVASSPFFNLFLMAQIKSQDNGFLSESIKVQALIEERGDVHHLFPKKFLQRNGFNNRSQYNQIANYVYTQSEVNIKIKDDAPNVYMKRVLDQLITKQPDICAITDEEVLKENLRHSCIPEGFENCDINDFQEFLQKRRLLMAKKIEEYYKEL